MVEKFNYEKIIEANPNLKILDGQLVELTDSDKSNDEITGVFNQELVESFNYMNFEVIPKLLDKINGVLDNPTLGLDNDTTEQLKNIKSLLQKRYDYIHDDFRIDNTPVDFNFINSLTVNDIKSLVDENFKKIRQDEIKKDKNGKDYVLIKGERFYINKPGGIYEHKDNVIFLFGNDLYLGNEKGCCAFYPGKNIIEITDRDKKEVRLSDGQSIIKSKDSNGMETRSSNGISINCELNYKNKLGYYGFYSDNNPDLFLYSVKPDGILDEAGVYLSFLKVTSILSNKKNDSKKCEIVNRNTLKFGDNTYEFNIHDDINSIVKWINNYKFDN